MRIVVTGGTGTVGKRLVEHLAARGAEVAALTRNTAGKPRLPEGAVYVEGDLADRDSLVRAFTGAEAAYLLTPLVRGEADLGRAAVWAAVDARVERLVFQSVHRAEQAVHIPHFGSKAEIADELGRSGLEWTVIAPGHFFQNDLDLRPMLTGPGVYPQPIGPAGVSRVDCDDIADAAARCLLEGGHAGERYALVGPEALTGEDMAGIWSRALDRPVSYAGDDLEAWGAQMRQVLPDWLVDDLVIMFDHFIEHGLVATAEEVAAVTRLLGRPPRRCESWATEVAASWR